MLHLKSWLNFKWFRSPSIIVLLLKGWAVYTGQGAPDCRTQAAKWVPVIASVYEKSAQNYLQNDIKWYYYYAYSYVYYPNGTITMPIIIPCKHGDTGMVVWKKANTQKHLWYASLQFLLKGRRTVLVCRKSDGLWLAIQLDHDTSMLHTPKCSIMEMQEVKTTACQVWREFPKMERCLETIFLVLLSYS